MNLRNLGAFIFCGPLMFAFIMRVLGQITAITKRKSAKDRPSERKRRQDSRVSSGCTCKARKGERDVRGVPQVPGTKFMQTSSEV